MSAFCRSSVVNVQCNTSSLLSTMTAGDRLKKNDIFCISSGSGLNMFVMRTCGPILLSNVQSPVRAALVAVLHCRFSVVATCKPLHTPAADACSLRCDCCVFTVLLIIFIPPLAGECTYVLVQSLCCQVSAAFAKRRPHTILYRSFLLPQIQVRR